MRPLRIGILGAGPAGLYAAVLLKNQNPAHQVTVIERNPAGATFGFGVVLSDKTLANFRAADPITFDAITAHQSSWGAIQTFHRGEPVTCGGHTYLGIARKQLLAILQARCEALGVDLHFQSELQDLSIIKDRDLIIAADGVNSLVRRTHADAFGPSIERGHSKYIWLGVKWTPTAFTFIFHETEAGLFQAHMYPFDESTSTCIVMCTDETWQRAGLDRLDEAASVRFCQELLRPYVGDAEFLANRSLWSTFQTVKNRCWAHGKIVLLGDAAHTAHWSIGSGTKLAMEDAIALVGALGRQADIPEALAAYEQERRPIVERLQAAARVSEFACEHAERYAYLDPVPFAFQLLTRSGRLDYAGLKQRDPNFIRLVDDHFTAVAAIKTGVAAVAGSVAPALTPLKLGDLILQNRLATSLPPGADWREHVGALRERLGHEPSLVLVETTQQSLIPELQREGFKVGLVADDQIPADTGADLLLSAFSTVGPAGRPQGLVLTDPSTPPAPGYDLYYLRTTETTKSDQIRNELRVKTMVDAPGALLDDVNTIIAASRADLCLVT